MKVTFEGKEYTIDLEKAKELGVLKEPNIERIAIGDVYQFNDGSVVMIVENGYSNRPDDQRWNIAGLNGLKLYSDFGKEGATEERMLAFLNGGKSGRKVNFIKFIKNINQDIAKLLKV